MSLQSLSCHRKVIGNLQKGYKQFSSQRLYPDAPAMSMLPVQQISISTAGQEYLITLFCMRRRCFKRTFKAQAIVVQKTNHGPGNVHLIHQDPPVHQLHARLQSDRTLLHTPCISSGLLSRHYSA